MGEYCGDVGEYDAGPGEVGEYRGEVGENAAPDGLVGL